MIPRDPLCGGWIEFSVIKDAVQKTTQFKPEVLVVSEEMFGVYLYASTAHGYGPHLRTEFAKVGIRRIIWAGDMRATDFALTSEKSYVAANAKRPGGIETISFLAP